MSRTDNTDPHWVRAIWWEPCHYRCDKASRYQTETPCDLPPEPIVAPEFGRRSRAWRLGVCFWEPTWDEMITGGGWSAPPWFNRVEFTVPERRRVRDQLVRARQEFRATGEVDVDVEARQHRHSGNWDWW